MKIMIIASGSKGNCTYIETGEYKILIDVGISHKRVKDNLLKINVDTNQITDVFLTHEHTDHIGGLYSFFTMSRSKAKIHLTSGTLYSILNNKYASTTTIKLIDLLNYKVNCKEVNILGKNDSSYNIIAYNNLDIQPIHAFHDAVEPVGYVLTTNVNKVVYLTDTGYVHNNILPLITNATCYILECNHDPEILMNSTRPYELKMRIISEHGHLSNEDGLYALAKVIGDKTKHVFYAHISEECNVIELVDLTRRKLFKAMGIVVNDCNFKAATQECMEVVEI